MADIIRWAIPAGQHMPVRCRCEPYSRERYCATVAGYNVFQILDGGAERGLYWATDDELFTTEREALIQAWARQEKRAAQELAAWDEIKARYDEVTA